VLDFIDCPDRRLTRAAAELVSAEAAVPGTHVTAVLPRRSYSSLLGRLLHDRTADKIAAVVSRIPHCTATIVPFDVRNRLEVLRERQNAVMAGTGPDGQAGLKTTGAGTGGALAADGHGEKTSAGKTAVADSPDGAVAAGAGEAGREDGQAAAPSPAPSAMRGLLPGRRSRQRRGQTAPGAADKAKGSYERPVPPPGVKPIGSIQVPGRATVEAGSGPWRSGRWRRVRCWPSRSPTRPGT
jgi:hypothetical protein